MPTPDGDGGEARGGLPAPPPLRGDLVAAGEFVTPPTVAAWMGVPVPAVYAGAERGEIPAIREEGGRWRFHGPTVRRWLEETGGGAPGR